MSEQKIIAEFNGNEVYLDELKVPVTDRAYMFGDAVYEVMRVYRGQVFLFEAHLARLANSLRAMHMEVSLADLREKVTRNIAANSASDAMVYLQISRGTASRNHSFHDAALIPNVLIYTKTFTKHPAKAEQLAGIKAITHIDLRWSRCDIKTVNLLANCLMQTYANEQGAAEAILIRDDMITEGSTSNVFLVKDGVYFTPPLSNFILPGTRRQFVIDRLRAAGCTVDERMLAHSMIADADEIFITSTVKEIIPVIEVDQVAIGTGNAGHHTRFAQRLMDHAIAALMA